MDLPGLVPSDSTAEMASMDSKHPTGLRASSKREMRADSSIDDELPPEAGLHLQPRGISAVSEQVLLNDPDIGEVVESSPKVTQTITTQNNRTFMGASLKELTQKNLRRIFRRVDVNNDSLLDYSEVRRCLESRDVILPYEAAVRAIMMEMDSNRSGEVSEDEFVCFFKRYTRDKIQEWLNEPHEQAGDDGLEISLVEYGSESLEAVRVTRPSVDDLAYTIAHQSPETRGWTRWFDISGFSGRVQDIVEKGFKLPKGSLQDVCLNQRSRVQILKSDSPNQQLHIISAAVSLEGAPIAEKEDGTFRLRYTIKEPRLTRQQTSVIVIDDRTLVTVRSPAVNQPVADDNSRGAPQRYDTKKGTFFGRARLPFVRAETLRRIPTAAFVHPVQGVDALWQEVCEELTTVFPCEMRTRNAKFLAFRLIDALIEYNWGVRDTFSDWMHALEKAIQGQPEPWHLNHIYMMQKASELALYDLNVPMLESMLGPHGVFFSSEALNLDKTRISAQHLQDSLQVLHSTSQRLQDLYASRASDSMNRVLYTLTLITATLTPLQFITGVYGMNFVRIPELEWDLGYLYFWMLAIGVFAAVLAFFRYRRFLSFSSFSGS